MPSQEYTFHEDYLALACDIEDANNRVILNPHHIHAESLLEIDVVWRADMNRHRRTEAYYRKKRGK